MAEPDLVAACIAAMTREVRVPVTVKCRIGIDDSEDFEFLNRFIGAVAGAGCRTFIIHARKAWLKGLSPKENREIPPLRYDVAARLKAAYPQLTIILNGGLRTVQQIDEVMSQFDGVMIGREAYQNPWSLAEMELHYYGTPLPERDNIANSMIPYIEYAQSKDGTPAHSITRHMLGLYNGLPGARLWRRQLSEASHAAKSPRELINDALDAIHSHQKNQLAA
jgi:tRNA-dihydrouridine synthase A